MTDQHFFGVPCPRCRQILKVAVTYNHQDPYPFKSSDLGGHHANCSSPSATQSQGSSPEQALESLHILMLPTC
jgi:hypothetical protein